MSEVVFERVLGSLARSVALDSSADTEDTAGGTLRGEKTDAPDASDEPPEVFNTARRSRSDAPKSVSDSELHAGIEVTDGEIREVAVNV